MEITLTFDPQLVLNRSLHVGDTIWYVTPSSAGGYSIADTNDVKKLGTVEFVSDQYRQAEIKVSFYHDPLDPNVIAPVIFNTDFVMFSKNNKANLSDLTGYFAETKFTNNSTEKIELFSIGSEIKESSK